MKIIISFIIGDFSAFQNPEFCNDLRELGNGWICQQQTIGKTNKALKIAVP